MTLRERLADWISGGDVTRTIDSLKVIHGLIEQKNHTLVKQRQALREIAAMETPKANATVKRMAKIAREAEK
jgi:hypothetical protein